MTKNLNSNNNNVFNIKMNSILSKLSLKDEEELYIPETESFIILKN